MDVESALKRWEDPAVWVWWVEEAHGDQAPHYAEESRVREMLESISGEPERRQRVLQQLWDLATRFEGESPQAASAVKHVLLNVTGDERLDRWLESEVLPMPAAMRGDYYSLEGQTGTLKTWLKSDWERTTRLFKKMAVNDRRALALLLMICIEKGIVRAPDAVYSVAEPLASDVPVEVQDHLFEWLGRSVQAYRVVSFNEIMKVGPAMKGLGAIDIITATHILGEQSEPRRVQTGLAMLHDLIGIVNMCPNRSEPTKPIAKLLKETELLTHAGNREIAQALGQVGSENRIMFLRAVAGCKMIAEHEGLRSLLVVLVEIGLDPNARIRGMLLEGLGRTEALQDQDLLHSIEKLETTRIVAKMYYEALGDNRYVEAIVTQNAHALFSEKKRYHRLRFGKESSVLIPLGGKRIQYLFRVLAKEAFEQWKRAADAQVPVEEILKSYPTKEGRRIVLTRFAGPSVDAYTPQDATEKAEIRRQAIASAIRLDELEIAHGHLHPGNVCVARENNAPLVRVIDFDEAHKKGALDESNTVRLERELRQLGY